MFKRFKLEEHTQKYLTNYPKTEKVYVIEWLHDNKSILGYGCDVFGKAALLPVNVKPNVYCVVTDINVVQYINVNPNLTATLIGPITSNNFNLLDFCTGDVKSFLVKVEFSSVEQAFKYHRIWLNQNVVQIKVSAYWDVHLMILLNSFAKTKTVNDVVNNWYDTNLNILNKEKPNIPKIYFDIETVSNISHRVPTGKKIILV